MREYKLTENLQIDLVQTLRVKRGFTSNFHNIQVLSYYTISFLRNTADNSCGNEFRCNLYN